MAITDRKLGSVADIKYGVSTVTTTAPTVAQVTALTSIECGIIGDTFDIPRSGATADISSLCQRETFNIAAAITNGDITADLWREFDATDVYWTLFNDTAASPVNGYLVVCSKGFSGALGVPAVTDKVDVYTCQVVSRATKAPNKTEGQRFTVTLSVVSVEFDKALV